MTTTKSELKHFLPIYIIFARFCKFQKLFQKKNMPKDLLKEGIKDADVNEGNLILNINVLFALQHNCFKN
jgi:hypothetical protein